MTGHEDGNRGAFSEAAAELSSRGYDVINPHDLDDGGTPNWIYSLKRDVAHVAKADVVAVMDGWEASEGAIFEVFIASKLGIPVIDAQTTLLIGIQPPKVSVDSDAGTFLIV